MDYRMAEILNAGEESGDRNDANVRFSKLLAMIYILENVL